MTTHVICLDGTGQERTQATPTNIALLFDALGGVVVDAQNNSFETTLVTNGVTVQVGKYLPGVGTGNILLFDFIDKASGDGIAEGIVRGYTFLSRNFEPGDEIVIVGFSRGAAAARCLAGFVAGQGLLNPVTYHTQDKDSAYLRGVAAWYRYRRSRPDLVKSENLTDVFLQFGEVAPDLTDHDFAPVERILAVGVFDTVSSLGIPRLNGDGMIYDFNLADTALSEKVLNGFHALAADEIRATFTPTFWTPRDRIAQLIFPGGHSDVGGGYAETGLSDRPLQWMMGKLHGLGVRFDVTRIRALSASALAVGHDESVLAPWNILPHPHREFPIDALDGGSTFEVDAFIGARWGKSVTLNPGGRTSPYKSLGVYADGRPLYGERIA